MREPLSAAARAPVLSVSDLTRLLRASLETEFAEVWVAGEVSNFRNPGSGGHYYFRLKDRAGQIAAVMFRSANRFLRFQLEDGMEVIAHGRVSLYEARGDLQLYVDALEPRGVGALRLALEQLQRRLAAEGVFDEARKRPLPEWPRAIGVITALSGAAVHDVVTSLRARLPGVRIVVRPVRVQGQFAGGDIVAALQDMAHCPEIEVIIVGRGGGSLEDLWAFNEERVARAVAAAPVPVVSAVGHEIDVTLTDLAADCRAATPTAAAALVVPDARVLQRQVAQRQAALAGAMTVLLRRRREAVQHLARHLKDPRRALVEQRLRVEELGERATRAMLMALRGAQSGLAGAAAHLQALSPLAVLERGYAIARRVPDGAVVRSGAEIAVGDRLDLTFRSGSARVRVERSSRE
ncbi:MAG: exodeoxyribonuclease VII large subunit [Deltaproteobacteria bacterium]|nr:exodeoxyribonuclease VII large subunit [Deltaproteobacteria bacterium]